VFRAFVSRWRPPLPFTYYPCFNLRTFFFVLGYFGALFFFLGLVGSCDVWDRYGKWDMGNEMDLFFFIIWFHARGRGGKMLLPF